MALPELKRPLIIDQLEALLRRLPPQHPKRSDITDHLRRFNIGFAGEQSLDVQLSLLPDDLHIFRQITLQTSSTRETFQIDLLIISPRFVFIGEVKNMAGTLRFDLHHGQLVRTLDGVEDIFRCPVRQSERQAHHFTSWLANHVPANVPVLPYVLIANYQSKIEAPLDRSNIFHAANLPSVIVKLHENHKKNTLTKKEMEKVVRGIKEADMEAGADLLRRFHIHETELMNAMTCQTCEKGVLLRKKHSWVCSSCRYRSTQAHVEALHDLSMLIRRPLKRAELERLFSGIPRRSSLRLIRPWTFREGYMYTLEKNKLTEAVKNQSKT
ncbi:nuclease-related domain-containing protein [Alkalicoccus chagannorensis]|uniref:nuclease-related domain-containing protein n=1 Tax=Alkalicoccus chagannorensis TaxID=427072 RepID=UPI000428C72A|nr:nuclease-related domain-containing protein [Alkalicoccus chagannorensis]